MKGTTILLVSAVVVFVLATACGDEKGSHPVAGNNNVTNKLFVQGINELTVEANDANSTIRKIYDTLGTGHENKEKIDLMAEEFIVKGSSKN